MKKWIVIPALAGAVVLGGVTMAANASNTDKSEVPASQDNLTIEEAESKAVETVGGKVTKVEFERERSGDIYEVEVISDGIEYDLDIDAKTGEVLRTEKDDDDSYDTNKKIRASDEKLLTIDEVIAIALKKAKGTVTDVELDDDDGRMHYDIEIEDGTYEYDFEIDAVTGEILDFEKERDND